MSHVSPSILACTCKQEKRLSYAEQWEVGDSEPRCTLYAPLLAMADWLSYGVPLPRWKNYLQEVAHVQGCLLRDP